MWHTKQGTKIELKDMTDAHIVNSIAYCERKCDFKSADIVRNEQRRRWMAQTRGCPWCDGSMTRFEDGNVDTWMPVWRWFCNKCGASSGPTEGPKS